MRKSVPGMAGMSSILIVWSQILLKNLIGFRQIADNSWMCLTIRPQNSGAPEGLTSSVHQLVCGGLIKCDFFSNMQSRNNWDFMAIPAIWIV